MGHRNGKGGPVSDFPQGTGRVAESFFLNAEFHEHAQIEIGKRDVFPQLDVAAGGEGTAGIARYDNGQVVVVVAVAVGNAAA